MIIQENDFLRAYNDTSELWDQAEEEHEEIDNVNSPEVGSAPTYSYRYDSKLDRQNSFLFNDVIDKANDAVDKINSGKDLEQVEVEYWTDLRAILEDKYKYKYSSKNKTAPHRIWCNRFISFFKSYLVEVAIKGWFKAQDWCANCEFQDKYFDQISLRAWEKISVFEDPEEALPDLEITFKLKPNETTTIPYSVDCKALNQTESKSHGADLVIRHSVIKNEVSGSQPIRFWLVGKDTTVKNIKNEFGGKPPFNIYCVASLQTGKLSGDENPTGEVELTGFQISNIYTKLCKIADVIQDDSNTDRIRTAYIINKRTKEINQTIYQDLRVDTDNFPADEPKDYKNPVAAAGQLVDYAQKLAAVVDNPAEEKLTGRIHRNSKQGEEINV